MDASQSLLSDLHEHHAEELKRTEERRVEEDEEAETEEDGAEADTKTEKKAAQKRCNASRLALARHGNRQNKDVVQLMLNIKTRMAISKAERIPLIRPSIYCPSPTGCWI